MDPERTVQARNYRVPVETLPKQPKVPSAQNRACLYAANVL